MGLQWVMYTCMPSMRANISRVVYQIHLVGPKCIQYLLHILVSVNCYLILVKFRRETVTSTCLHT